MINLSNLKPADARAAIRGARSGTVICYHRGYLLFDRKTDPRVAAIADIFLQAGTEEGWGYCAHSASLNGLGLGVLTQRKVSDGKYHYLFTKR